MAGEGGEEVGGGTLKIVRTSGKIQAFLALLSSDAVRWRGDVITWHFANHGIRYVLIHEVLTGRH